MHKPHHLCAALRSYRIKARIKQEIIAGILGVTQSQISRWESGRDFPRAQNAEAIRALIWGDTVTPIAALARFVSSTDLPLVLFDHHHNALAVGRPFQTSPSDLNRFGHILDPDRNPAFAEIFGNYRSILQDPQGLVGLEIRVPFLHDGAPWVALARKTIYAVDGLGVCLAELHFLQLPEGSRLEAPSMVKVRPDAPAVHPHPQALANFH